MNESIEVPDTAVPVPHGPEPGSRTPRTIYLDVTDLIQYAEHNATLSGIQRVNASLLANVPAWRRQHPDVNIVPVIPEYDRFSISAVDYPTLQSMFRMLETPTADRVVVKRLVRAVYESRYRVTAKPGDIFVMAGAFWICQHYDMIIQLRAAGVHFALFIHDLIQINNPEYVQHVATLVFRKSLIDALSVASFVMTNSEFVAEEVRTFLRQRLDLTIPVRAILLATELPAVGPGDAVIRPDIRALARRDYVLSVGTIEIRKNHLYLVKIWERLLQEGVERVPDLVFVGKWGWKIEELREHLSGNPLRGRLHIFNNASDQELAFLYENCLLTAYPSFAEGFGLPVGESLAYGKPCIASSTTSMPEVGGAFARYVDPMDVEQGYGVFRDALADRERCARWAQEISHGYKPKTWAQFSDEFFAALLAALPPDAREMHASNCLLASGTTYFIGSDDVQRLSDANRSLVTFRMARLSGWGAIEPWGCWATQSTARLKFQTTERPGTRVQIVLLLHAPPGSKKVDCKVEVGGRQSRIASIRTVSSWHMVDGQVSEDGSIDILFSFSGDFGRPDHRSLYVGIRSLAFCLSSDLRTRRTFATRVLLSSIAPALRTGARLLGTGPEVRALAAERQRELVTALVDSRLVQQESQIQGRSDLVHAGHSDQFSGQFQLQLPNPTILVSTEPYMASANCLARDFYNAGFGAFCRMIRHDLILHRRLWELAFIFEQLRAAGVVRAGARGVKVGSEREQLSSLFAQLGCDVSVIAASSRRKASADPAPLQPARDALFFPEIVDEEVFEQRVRVVEAAEHRTDAGAAVDFCWSCGDVEQAGSVAEESAFVIETVESIIRPGGIACFTRELNLTTNEGTADRGGSGLFRRRDIEELIGRLEARGHRVKPLPLEAGMTFLDTLVAVPPYGGVHLKVQADDFVATSFGLVVHRAS